MQYAWEVELPAMADMSDRDAASEISGMTEDVIKPITSAELLAWVAQAGRFAKIDQATQSENAELRSLACAAKLLISRDVTVLDLNLPDRVAMVDAVVQAGVLSDLDKADLYSRATMTRSKYGRVREGEVQMARAQQ